MSYRFTKTPENDGRLDEEVFRPLASSEKAEKKQENAQKSVSFNEPKVKSTKGSRRVMLSILVTELCERLTFYSLVANLVLFGTSVLRFSSTDSATMSLVFTGTCYFVPLIGGFIADAYLGQYNTLLLSGLTYIVGTAMIFAVGIPNFGQDSEGKNYVLSLSAKRGFTITGLALIAIGTGGIKVNVSPFGARQLDGQGEKAVQSFFNWFYWFINVGSAIAYTFVAYIQQEVGFDYGLAIPLISMILGILLFASARNQYRIHPPGESPLGTVWKIIKQGRENKRNRPGTKLPSFLDYANIRHGGTYSSSEVEGVKSLGRIVPIFAFMILYWTMYFQMQSTFFLQSERMDISIADFNFPAASLSIFNSAIILIMLPFVDRVLYPAFDRLGMPLTHLKRMGIGMILASCSMLSAGILEFYRRRDIEENGCIYQLVGDEEFCASQISIFAQVPSFALIGASEVFASVAGLEFAYSQAPTQLQGVVMGICLITSGFGSYLGSALVNIVNAASDGEWLPEEFNEGRADYYFYLLAGLLFTNFLFFLIAAKRFKYKNVKINDTLDSERTPLIKGDEASHLYETVH